MFDSVQLATLAAVVEHGSFEAAAGALQVTPSAVSQRIKALEQSAGQVLVRRARPTRATPAGQVLVRLAGEVALLDREARRALGEPGPVRLAIAVNADSMSTWFPAVLAGLAPTDVLLDLRRADQDVTADLLRDGTVTAAVTADPRPVQGCRSVPLGAMRYLALAAPGFGAAEPGSPAGTWAAAPLVAFDRDDTLQDRFLGGLGVEASGPRHLVAAQETFLAALRAGLGWGMVPGLTADAELAAGRLVDLAPGRWLDVPLHWQRWRVGSSALARVTELVLAAAAAGLRPPGGPRG